MNTYHRQNIKAESVPVYRDEIQYQLNKIIIHSHHMREAFVDKRLSREAWRQYVKERNVIWNKLIKDEPYTKTYDIVTIQDREYWNSLYEDKIALEGFGEEINFENDIDLLEEDDIMTALEQEMKE